MVYLKSVENVITLGKLIGLLFLFCLPLLSILFLKTKMNDLARPVMGTIFLVNIYISREISIEHPSVGLASLTQICCRYVVCRSFVKLTAYAELRSPRACSKSFLGGKD